MRFYAFIALTAAVCAQQQLSVSFDASKQIVSTYRGVGAVRHGFDYQPEQLYRGMNDTWRNVAYERISQARLASARTYHSSDWSMPYGWGTAVDFTTPRFEAFAQWVADMQQRNVSVVLNAAWWFTQNVCGAGAPSNCTPTNASVAVYTQWISAAVKELVVTRGFTNVDTLLLFTEPLSYDAGNIPPGYNQSSFYVAVVQALHAQMMADGTRHLVAFHGPNDGAIDSQTDLTALTYCVQQLNGIIDIWTSHTYELPNYASWFAVFQRATAITAPTGKPFWVDEGGAGPESTRNGTDYGTYVALWQAALMNGGASHSFLWLFQDQYYVWPLENATNNDSFDNGLHRWGLFYWLPDSAAVRPAWYAWSTIARFLRPPPGALTASTYAVMGMQPGTGVVAAAVGAPGYRALLLVNEANATTSVSVTLQGYSDAGAAAVPLSRYLYDPANVPTDAQPLPPSGSFTPTGAPLTDTLPPRGVAVWVTDSVWEGYGE